MKLYYFDASNLGMGFIPSSTLTTDTSYSVAVNAGDILSINGENEPRIYFTQGQKYLFEQSDATNQEYRLTFPYYDTGSGTWIDTNTGVTPHGVPGRNGAYTYFEPDTLADLTRVCLVKDGVRKTALYAPVVTIEDISFGVLGKAYGGIPFTVTFTSGIDDGSFSITDANGVAISLTSPTATDLSYGTSSIEVTIGANVSSGVMTIGGTNGTTQTFDYEAFAQTFVVTIGQSSGNDVFLIDGASNVDLGLENGKSYMFDLSYSESYTFGLATEIDGANSSAYTDNITNVSNYMIVQNVSASSTLYYYAVGYSNMGNRLKISVTYNLNGPIESSLPSIIGTKDFTIEFANVTQNGSFAEFISSPTNGETWNTYFEYGIFLYWYKYDRINYFRLICNDSAIDFGNPSEPFTGTIEVQRQNNTLKVFVNNVNTAYTVVSADWLLRGGKAGFFTTLNRPNIGIGNADTSGTISIVY